MQLQDKCFVSCTSLIWWTLVVRSQQPSKEFLLPISTEKSFLWFVYQKSRRSDEYWSIDYEFAGIDTAGEEAFTIACGGLKGAITSKRSQLVLIDDPIKSAASINNPDIRREMEQTWSNVIAPTMFQGAHGQFVSGRAFTLTIYTPRYLFQKIIGSRLFSKQS